ncbi:MAG: hypothetical protein HY619_04060 [Thaumarchaeota archaeon]|nr:hypothetical protein [Nitrososphaerota archaeon]
MMWHGIGMDIPDALRIRRTIMALLTLCLVATAQFPLEAFAQRGMASELSSENETWVMHNLVVAGAQYTLVTYSNGDVLLLDGKDGLVTIVSTLEDVYGVKSFKDIFADNGLTSTNVQKISESLDSLHSNAKLVNDIMTWVAIAAAAAGIASIFVGGVAIPIAIVVGAVKFSTHYIVENTERPKATASELRNLLAELERGNAKFQDYKQALVLASKLRSQLKDLNSQLILQVTGFGNLAYYKALYSIADVVSGVAGEQAKNLRQYGSAIEKSQSELEAALGWLDKLDTESIQQAATIQTNNYMKLQASRIESRKRVYESLFSQTQSLLVDARNKVNTASQKGLNALGAYSILSQAESKMDDAKNRGVRFEYRSAIALLTETSKSSQQIDSTLEQAKSQLGSGSRNELQTSDGASEGFPWIYVIPIVAVALIAVAAYARRRE